MEHNNTSLSLLRRRTWPGAAQPLLGGKLMRRWYGRRL